MHGMIVHQLFVDGHKPTVIPTLDCTTLVRTKVFSISSGLHTSLPPCSAVNRVQNTFAQGGKLRDLGKLGNVKATSPSIENQLSSLVRLSLSSLFRSVRQRSR
jgi:hypothetical protein